jgi:hypothetical protein
LAQTDEVDEFPLVLAERFARLPRDSGVARFLAGPNEFGWDIKRKLLWLGINSYLFRFHKWKITKSRGGSQTS